MSLIAKCEKCGSVLPAPGADCRTCRARAQAASPSKPAAGGDPALEDLVASFDLTEHGGKRGRRKRGKSSEKKEPRKRWSWFQRTMARRIAFAVLLAPAAWGAQRLETIYAARHPRPLEQPLAVLAAPAETDGRLAVGKVGGVSFDLDYQNAPRLGTNPEYQVIATNDSASDAVVKVVGERIALDCPSGTKLVDHPSGAGSVRVPSLARVVIATGRSLPWRFPCDEASIAAMLELDLQVRFVPGDDEPETLEVRAPITYR